MAEWQSGYAADCNSVNIGSIPFSASNMLKITKNESFYTNANIEKAKKVLRYTPKTEFEDRIKQFINWYGNYAK